MKILVTGKGGREHAILTALRECAPEAILFSYPGSDAIAEIATRVEAKDLLDLIAFMQREKVDLCVAGEEAYLVKDRAHMSRIEKEHPREPHYYLQFIEPLRTAASDRFAQHYGALVSPPPRGKGRRR